MAPRVSAKAKAAAAAAAMSGSVKDMFSGALVPAAAVKPAPTPIRKKRDNETVQGGKQKKMADPSQPAAKKTKPDDPVLEQPEQEDHKGHEGLNESGESDESNTKVQVGNQVGEMDVEEDHVGEQVDSTDGGTSTGFPIEQPDVSVETCSELVAAESSGRPALGLPTTVLSPSAADRALAATPPQDRRMQQSESGWRTRHRFAKLLCPPEPLPQSAASCPRKNALIHCLLRVGIRVQRPTCCFRAAQVLFT